MINELDRLMTITDLSEMLGVPVDTLYGWRHRGEGPEGYRIGRHVRYPFWWLKRAQLLSGTQPVPQHPRGAGRLPGQTARRVLSAATSAGCQHPAERRLHRLADACVVGDLHHAGSPVGHGHREL